MKKHGFTVVELIVVITVIAIIAGISVAVYRGVEDRAKASAASQIASQASKAIDYYIVKNRQAPSDLSAAKVSSTNIQYSVTTGSTEPTYCLTATSGDVSYFVNNTTTKEPTKGGCPGHGLAGQPSITNYINNPSFEIADANWDYGSYTQANRSTERPRTGATSVKFVGQATAIDRYFQRTYVAQSTGPHTISAWVYLTGNGATYSNRTAWLGGGSVNTPYNKTLLNQWQRVSATYNLTAGASVLIRFYCPAASTTYIDDVMVTQGSTLYPYADGTSSGWAWQGVAHDSFSNGPVLAE